MKEYFPHDFNARTDPKLQEVIMAHGMAGIGVYWCVIELMYEQGGELPMNRIKGIAFNLHVDAEIVESIIRDFGLFDISEDTFTSASLKTRLKNISDRSEKAKASARARWKKGDDKASKKECERNANAMRTHEEDDANAMRTQCERNANKIKENNIHSISSDKSSDILTLPSKEERAYTSNKGRQIFSEIKELWNTTCLGYQKILALSEARKNKIKIRITEMGGEDKAIPILAELFKKMQASKFLQGDNPRGWKATFDWLFQNDTNWVKVYEGNYDTTNNEPYERDTNNHTGDAASRRRKAAAELTLRYVTQCEQEQSTGQVRSADGVP